MVDRFSSHVLQALLYKATQYLDCDGDDALLRCVLQLGAMFLDRSDLISDRYASHVIRTLVEVMAGSSVATKIVRGRYANVSGLILCHLY